MTVMATEVLTADEIVMLARKQIDIFNAGDWEQFRKRLPPIHATTSWEPSGRSRVRRRSSSSSRAGRRRSRTSPAR